MTCKNGLWKAAGGQSGVQQYSPFKRGKTVATCRCFLREAERGVLEPEFKIVTGAFVVVFRLPPTLEDLEKSGLNGRQVKAVEHVEKMGFITNKGYRALTGAAKWTSTKDLASLVKRGILLRTGRGKRGLRYVLAFGSKGAKKVPKKVPKKKAVADIVNDTANDAVKLGLT